MRPDPALIPKDTGSEGTRGHMEGKEGKAEGAGQGGGLGVEFTTTPA